LARPSRERVRSEATAVSPQSTSERFTEGSLQPPKSTNETTSEVSRAVRAGITDAVGEAVVRVRDQAAANASAQAATAIDAPDFRAATPEEEQKFRRIRQALGETPEKEANE
jgi:hypothetical protein